MKNSYSIINKLLIVILLYSIQCNSAVSDTDPILIVVSYDAFRNEYFQRGVTNYMNKHRVDNTYADYIRNVFPTKTFPNHFSIATGLYPGQHGVISNQMYDVSLNETLQYGYKMFHYNKDVEPIWIANQRSPNKYSGCMMWPGGEFEYNNITCQFIAKFDPSMDHFKRVDQAMSWILNKETPANLVMLYIEEPDMHAHAYGPESQTITDLVKKLDQLAEHLDDKIKENHLEHRVNVVHLSDHGMDSVMPQNFINITDYLSPFEYISAGRSPVTEIFLKNEADVEPLYKILQSAARKSNTFNVYKYKDLPARWHFQNIDRVAPITIVANQNYAFDDMWTNVAAYEKQFNIPVTNTQKYGIHGYDNNLEIMNSMFFASGPAIKKNNKVAPFDTVDLIYLFCEILKIEPPAGISGNRQNILPILEFQSESIEISALLVALGSFLTSIILVGTIASILILRKRHKDTQVPPFLYEENDITILEEQKLLQQNTPSINSSSSGDIDINI